MVKRVFDIVVSFLLILLTLPFWIIIPIMIIRDSGLPVFYRSKRIGLNGKIFYMLKFRTMNSSDKIKLTKEQLDEFNKDFKLTDDPRITRIGSVLRKLSLDELPQLLNVLRGEMSLVGPRPKLPEEIYLYGKKQDILLSVLPGVTGFWQVFRKSSASDINMRKMDIYYIKKQSFLMDIYLLIKTPLVVISGRND